MRGNAHSPPPTRRHFSKGWRGGGGVRQGCPWGLRQGCGDLCLQHPPLNHDNHAAVAARAPHTPHGGGQGVSDGSYAVEGGMTLWAPRALQKTLWVHAFVTTPSPSSAAV